jgi:hypothetical protein
MRVTKTRRVAFIVLVVIAAAAVCGWTAWNWNRLRPYHWQQVESPDATFSMNFPVSPKASTQNDTDAIDGRQFVANRLVASPAPRIGYAVSWWENPEQKDKPTGQLFADFRDRAAAEAFRGKVASKELTVAGNPAIDIITADTYGTVVYNRVIRAGPRIYSLWVIDGSGRFAVDKKDVGKFFNSFSLH